MASSQRIYRSEYPPPHVPTNVSISQLLKIYNPDDVNGDKIICEDDWTGKKITYASIREESGKGAFGLAHILNLAEGDVVCICAPNSVSINQFAMSNSKFANSFLQVDVVKLIHAVLWRGAIAVYEHYTSTSVFNIF